MQILATIALFEKNSNSSVKKKFLVPYNFHEKSFEKLATCSPYPN